MSKGFDKLGRFIVSEDLTFRRPGNPGRSQGPFPRQFRPSSPYLDSPVNRIQLSCVVVHRIFSAGLIGPLLVMADRLHPYLRPRKWNHIVPGHDENSRTGRLSWLRPQRARAAIGVFPRRSDRCAIKRRSCSQAEVMFGSTVRPLCSGPDSPNRVSRRPICVGPVCSLEQRLPCWTRVVGGH